MREKIASGTVDSSVQSRFCVRISGRDHFVWAFRQLQTVSFFLFSLEGCFESVDKAVNCDHHKIKILPEQ